MTVNTQAPARGRLVGSSRFVTATHRWAWSDEVARMYVYEPGRIVRSTKMVLSHKHPHDKANVAALIDDAIQYGQLFSSHHRVIDAEGPVHVVVVVGNLFYDEKEPVIGTAGFTSTSPTPTKAIFKTHLKTQVTAPKAVPMSSGFGVL